MMALLSTEADMEFTIRFLDPFQKLAWPQWWPNSEKRLNFLLDWIYGK